MKSQPRSALFYGTLAIDDDTEMAAAPAYGQVWVGGPDPGVADFHIAGTADSFERLAAALMLAATDMREAALVEALGPSGQPSTSGAAA